MDNLDEILKTLEKFGFKFFGYNEAKSPLVSAPNGQIVTVEVAYKFVQTKLVNSSAQGGSVENMPNIQYTPEAQNQSIDQKLEQISEQSKFEKHESAPEKESSQNSANTPQTNSTVTPKPAAVVKRTIDIPFGDGFYPKAFDPKDIDSALNYVEKMKTQTNLSNSKAWLRTLFEKFITEMNPESK